MPATTATPTHRLTVTGPNRHSDVTFHVHAARCADLRRREYVGPGEKETGEWTSLQALVEDYYCHQIDENDTTWDDGYEQDFKLFPCTAGLPRDDHDDLIRGDD